MRIAIIGASGHYPYVVEGASQRPDMQIVAIAPGTPGEDISGLKKRLEDKGFSPKAYDWWTDIFENEQNRTKRPFSS